jgi:ABC-type polysaccharide/polyol phosphate export permease
MTPIVDAYRDVLVRGHSPFTPELAGAAAVSFLTLAVAWFYFHRAEFQFAENI